MKVSAFLILFVLTGCSILSKRSDYQKENEAQPLFPERLQWLNGDWSTGSSRGIYSEQWRYENDTLFRGRSFMVRNSDTLFSETIELYLSSKEIYYVPSVSNQNEGKPILFRLTSAIETTFTFENPLHDFPQRIVYSHPAPDSLVACLEGDIKGVSRKEYFRMKRQSSKE